MKINDILYDNNHMESLFRSKNLTYNSPYTLDEIVNRTKELNDLNFNLNKNKSVAVVGNSGILKEREYGEIIDNHDLVFRCNLGKVKGFEKHVGTKTDFRFIAGKSFWYHNLKNNFLEFEDDFLTKLENQRFIIKANPLYNSIQGIIKHYKTKNKIHFLNQNFVDNVESVSKVNFSSLGFITICVAIQFFSNVSIFGFGFFKESWDNRHYFEKVLKYSGVHTKHKKDEENFINYLEKNKMIRIYK